jgi:phospholipid:diacylglycerol acyltransferase
VYVIKLFISINVFEIFRFPGYWLWSKVLQNLADIGYDSTNLVTLGYDWRLPPQFLEERDGYYTQLKFYTEFLR